MAIPPFGAAGVIPPYVGNPATGSRSPHKATADEVVASFATSRKRCDLLDGWLRFREELRKLGMTGFQWLDGSFCEDLSKRQPSEPNDIDVVTFFGFVAAIALTNFQATMKARPDLLPGPLAKTTYGCDVYYVSLAGPDIASVRDVHYWYGLFSHRRGDEAWKGLLQVPLPTTPTDDGPARARLTAAAARFTSPPQGTP